MAGERDLCHFRAMSVVRARVMIIYPRVFSFGGDRNRMVYHILLIKVIMIWEAGLALSTSSMDSCVCVCLEIGYS